MNATIPEFSGLTYHTVAQIVGPEAARLLIQIDHEHLEYGKNWRMTGGRQVFTEAGLELIANELHARGHDGAAVQLRTAVRQAIAAERAVTPVPASDEELVAPRYRWQEIYQ
jgi:hypothetical protein